MKAEKIRYTMRVEKTLFDKFKFIAASEGRSANKEIIQYVKARVKAFEEENGTIIIEENDK